LRGDLTWALARGRPDFGLVAVKHAAPMRAVQPAPGVAPGPGPYGEPLQVEVISCCRWWTGSASRRSGSRRGGRRPRGQGSVCAVRHRSRARGVGDDLTGSWRSRTVSDEFVEAELLRPGDLDDAVCECHGVRLAAAGQAPPGSPGRPSPAWAGRPGDGAPSPHDAAP